MAALAQATSTPPTPDADAKVAAILDGILRRGEGHAEGREDVKTSTWVPPSFADIEQIREIGHDAYSTAEQSPGFSNSIPTATRCEVIRRNWRD